MALDVYIKLCETVDGVEKARYAKLADNRLMIIELLTTAERLALGLGAGDAGYSVWDTDLNAKYTWNGTAWNKYSGWRAPNLTLGDFALSGAALQRNTGAGYHIRFDAASNDIAFANIHLDGFGADYDGSDLALRINSQLFDTAPVAGNNVKWEVNYAFVKADETQNALTLVSGTFTDTIDVAARSADILYSDMLTTMGGVADANQLQISIYRLSVGGGSDTYPNSVDVYSIGIERV